MPEAIGVFGGTFDPVHFGHLRLAEEACAALGLAQVLWVPAGRPPHRAAPHASGAHRLQMVRLAIAGNPRFALDPAETESGSESYTVDTLARLRRRFGPTRPLVFLLGADAFAALPAWHRWRELFQLAHLAVATRPQSSLAPDALPPALAGEWRARLQEDARALAGVAAGRIVSFDITALDIAATHVREALIAGRSPRYLLPDPVLDYIDRNHLYT